MTIIAAAYSETHYAIACDTNSSSSWTKGKSQTKIFCLNEEVLVGYTGTYLLDHWIQAHMAKVLMGHTLREAAFNAWDEWRSFSRTRWHGKTNNDGELSIPGSIIVINPSGLFTCQTDGSILEHFDYTATGSGQFVALGSFHRAFNEPSYLLKNPVGVIVEEAVEAAIHHTPFCGGEIKSICLEKK